MKEHDIIEWRRHIHRNAELSFEENETQCFICSVLEKHNIKYVKIAKTGVLVEIGENRKNTVVLRADMDALPIKETADVEFKSANNGVMHACGHDMHSAMLLGALVALAKNPPKDRCVVGLFQPGEEMHPGGASLVLAEKPFEKYEIKAFVGQHCSPEMAVGTIGMRAGEFMASTDEVHITVRGQGGHAALPHLLRDPVIAAAALLLQLKKIAPKNDIKHVLAFGRVVADGATNIIPSEVYIEGTFRTFSEAWRGECKAQIQAVARAVEKEYNVTIDAQVMDGYPSVLNDEQVADRARALIVEQFGTAALIDLEQRMTAEDFGFYTRLYPSLFLRLGVGSDTKLHTGDFCPDERSLLYGARLLETLARGL